MNRKSDYLIINVFALLHAAVSFACRYFGLLDDLLLTILSMMMVSIICFKHQRGAVFLIASIVAANVLGYLLGAVSSWIFARMLSSDFVIYPVSTFICTQIIGWGVYVGATLLPGEGKKVQSFPVIGLLLAFVLIIVVRLILIVPKVEAADTRTISVNMLVDYAFSCLAFILMADYMLRARNQLREEKEKANLAQYRYQKLKQQVNPHFLFNSLNILDCMIQEQSPEEASRYTHKLAEIYRYLLHSEDREKVSLGEELDFVSQYVDLLMVRFPEGLQVRIDVPESALSLAVIPCSLQLLIENATKHNAVLPQNPLVVEIRSDGDRIYVSNTIQPRVGYSVESMGLGLKYIRRQYEDIGGETIVVEETESEYKVILPLL